LHLLLFNYNGTPTKAQTAFSSFGAGLNPHVGL